MTTRGGRIASGIEGVKRLVVVDQKAIGRTPRSNLATYTGLFDHVRRIFAATPAARARRYDAGRFSFNVPKRGAPPAKVRASFASNCYSFPASTPLARPATPRYNPETLAITYRGNTIAAVLDMTVDAAFAFFAQDVQVRRSLAALRQVGLGYLRLGQPATQLSGGEAQRIKLATELQRAQLGQTLYVLDEPTTGLHPADVEMLVAQLDQLGGCRQYRCRNRA